LGLGKQLTFIFSVHLDIGVRIKKNSKTFDSPRKLKKTIGLSLVPDLHSEMDITGVVKGNCKV
jgi:hypothetical protein